MVTFETKCWENDWEFILKGPYLKMMIERCQYNFTSKQLIINNVLNRDKIEGLAKEKVREGIIDHFYFAEDYAEEVLKRFQIKRDSFQGGYNYSIAELVGVYVCDTEFLLHFSSDSYMIKPNDYWIRKSLDFMSQHPDCIAASALRKGNLWEVQSDAVYEDNDYVLGYGFSDQVYLIKTAEFKKPVYSEAHSASEKYPKYGGYSFEKRVDSYLRNHQLKRYSPKGSIYLSHNFPKGIIRRSFRKLIIRIKYVLHRSGFY